MTPGEIIALIGGFLGVMSTIVTWLKGGFKRHHDIDDAVELVHKHEDLSKTRALTIEHLTHRVNQLEKDNIEIKRNHTNLEQQIMVKLDDTNKLLMDLMYKLGELTGKADR